MKADKNDEFRLSELSFLERVGTHSFQGTSYWITAQDISIAVTAGHLAVYNSAEHVGISHLALH